MYAVQHTFGFRIPVGLSNFRCFALFVTSSPHGRFLKWQPSPLGWCIRAAQSSTPVPRTQPVRVLGTPGRALKEFNPTSNTLALLLFFKISFILCIAWILNWTWFALHPRHTHTTGDIWQCLEIFVLRFYLFLERREEKERERERNINVWLPLMRPPLGTQPTTQACALTGNWTTPPPAPRSLPNPLSHTSQG